MDYVLNFVAKVTTYIFGVTSYRLESYAQQHKLSIVG